MKNNLKDKNTRIVVGKKYSENFPDILNYTFYHSFPIHFEYSENHQFLTKNEYLFLTNNSNHKAFIEGFSLYFLDLNQNDVKEKNKLVAYFFEKKSVIFAPSNWKKLLSFN
ncbi:MAG: hypothetical protein HQK51_21025 [Oligoflexia bacterium]|nr:hypothetical protein [Oligoflexia bacterium]